MKAPEPTAAAPCAGPTTVDALLEGARARTLALTALDDDALRAQHSPLMSPLVWDLAHIANYEDLWLVRALGGAPVRADLDLIYDAFENPRADRPALDLLAPAEARQYLVEVRRAAQDLRASGAAVSDDAPALLTDDFVYRMVIQHEHMHDETMLATRQLMGDASLPPPGATCTPDTPGEGDGPDLEDDVVVPAGTYPIGADRSQEPWAFDNEGGRHDVTLEGYAIDVVPVTNRAYQAFIEAGGYDDRDLWSAEGWQWRTEAGLVAPQFWSRSGDTWTVERFGRIVVVDPREPVQHVCWYEADAYARWSGGRLPTEQEWEVAASIDPSGGKRRYPWGETATVAPVSGGPPRVPANLGQRNDGPRPVGANPDGVSPFGCHDLIGDVWEWTSSEFEPYPGFEAFPYREYSEVFWGDGHRVLRGGSWAVDPVAVRTTFRNWDHPIRRQIFAGFRCARDLPAGAHDEQTS